MLKFDEFRKQFEKGLLAAVSEMNKDGGTLRLEKRRIMKNNQKLHAFLLTAEDIMAAPVVYAEDFYSSYKKGGKVDDLVIEAIKVFAYGIFNQPRLSDYSDIIEEPPEESLIVHLVEVERNKEWLKDAMHMEVGAGLTFVLYLMMVQNGHCYGCPMTKEMCLEKGLGYEEAFSMAIANTARKFPPILTSVFNTIKEHPLFPWSNKNPYSDDYEFEPNEDMYMLSTNGEKYGATALFYPGMQEIIATLLDGDYYVVPSSVDEVLIVPTGRGREASDLQKMIVSVNKEFENPGDILSDRVLYYNRESGKLEEPPLE